MSIQSRIQNLRISTKLLMGFSLIIILVVFIGFIGIRGSKIIHKQFQHILDFGTPKLQALFEIRSIASEIDAQTMSFELIDVDSTVVEGSQGGRKKSELLANIEKMDKWVERYQVHMTGAGNTVLIQNIDKQKETVVMAALDYIRFKEEKAPNDRLVIQRKQLIDRQMSLKKAIFEAIDYELQELERSKIQAGAIAGETIHASVILTFIGVLVALGLGFLFSRLISIPIQKLRNTTLEIAQGKLNQRADIASKDEIGDLAVSFNQMTESLMQAQTQLLQSEKLASVGQLAAGVAHEINNPVGFISNNMEILGQYIGDYGKLLRMVNNLKAAIEQGDLEKARLMAEEMTKFEQEINLDYIINDINNLLQHNQRGIERIQKIVLDLRTFSREDKEAMELVKIEEVIDSILSIVHNELKYKAELKKSYGETTLIKCNAQRLGQVFINLFVNAAQAMDEKGTIEVKTYTEGKFVCVDVVDTGKGIPEENLKKVFDAFFTTKPVGQGTGLGLSVSYEIVKKHGGEMKVQSKVGEGTTFTVMLPIT